MRDRLTLARWRQWSARPEHTSPFDPAAWSRTPVSSLCGRQNHSNCSPDASPHGVYGLPRSVAHGKDDPLVNGWVTVPTAGGRQMSSPASTFTIVYQPLQPGPWQVLGDYADANAVTVVAHQLLDRLRKQGRGGEVQVIRADAEPTVVLRLPLAPRPTRRRLTAGITPADGAVRQHPAWMITSAMGAWRLRVAQLVAVVRHAGETHEPKPGGAFAQNAADPKHRRADGAGRRALSGAACLYGVSCVLRCSSAGIAHDFGSPSWCAPTPGALGSGPRSSTPYTRTRTR